MLAMEASPVHDFGSALAVDAEAIGKPGQRRFRLLVLSGGGAASIWMEKEQLSGIGVWVGEVLARLEPARRETEPDVEPLPFPPEFLVEFRAAQLALGYVEDNDVFMIQAFEAPIESEGQRPTFRCFLSRAQARSLAAKIGRVIAAGRPLCPLCDLPMDPEGHRCIRGNGHRPTRILA
jgi:uncharacterized repeat protein (TIGR03847 family)